MTVTSKQMNGPCDLCTGVQKSPLELFLTADQIPKYIQGQVNTVNRNDVNWSAVKFDVGGP